ncbi:MAG: SOS response-associated peptidase [Candidatus Limnocylindrales bacterium]
MCGRFTQRLSSSDFARIFGARDLVESAGEAYNVAPAQRVAVVVEREEERLLEPMRWGLVPGWAKSPLGGRHPINARAETVAASPLFRHAFRVKRCLVPADGFYEWQRLPDGRRQPHYISASDGRPLAFAGLWSAWSERTSEAPALLTCAILTTTPNATMATIHDRMPVILTPEAWGLWLGRTSDPSELQGLLRPYSGDLLLYPMAPLVNSVRQQGPALIAPLVPD